MVYEKVYVSVIVKFLSDGGMRPLEIVWTDGRRYVIDRVKYISNAPTHVSTVTAKRYTVMVNGVEKYLFFEDNNERWFVERRVK